MVYRSPQLVDELIMQRAQRPGMVVDPSQIMASNAASQAADTNMVDAAGKSLNLQGNRLAENKRQFNANLGLQKDLSQYNRRQGNVAAAISALGLGVSGLNNYQSNKESEQQNKIRQSMINDLNMAGDTNSKYFAKLMQLLPY
jgi:uncharacterized protein YccT (UPF0319 family)